MNKTTILFTLLVAALMLASCTTSMSAEELQANIIKANSNINTYTMTSDTTMKMSMEVDGEQVSTDTTMQMDGSFDREAKKMYAQSTLTTDVMGETANMNVDMYLIEDTIYQKMGGIAGMEGEDTPDQWMKLTYGADIWAEQDQAEQINALIETGAIEILDDETIDGVDYYVAKVTPDIKKLFEIAYGDQKDQLAMLGDMNFEDMIKSYEVTVWVNKETYVIEREKIYTNLIMTPSDLGIPDAEDEAPITMEMDMDVVISNVNEPVSIELPEEAADAVDMSALMAGQA